MEEVGRGQSLTGGLTKESPNPNPDSSRHPVMDAETICQGLTKRTHKWQRRGWVGPVGRGDPWQSMLALVIMHGDPPTCQLIPLRIDIRR